MNYNLEWKVQIILIMKENVEFILKWVIFYLNVYKPAILSHLKFTKTLKVYVIISIYRSENTDLRVKPLEAFLEMRDSPVGLEKQAPMNSISEKFCQQPCKAKCLSLEWTPNPQSLWDPEQGTKAIYL